MGPRPRLHRRRADLPAVPRPLRHRLVQGDGRRHRAEPVLRRARVAGPDPRPLGRPHLQDELRVAHRVPPREAGGLHDRDVERDARRGHAHGHPRDRREPARQPVRREAGRPAGHARVDGHLRVRPHHARAGPDGGLQAPRLRRTTSARTSSRAWSRPASASSPTRSRATGWTSGRSRPTGRRRWTS